MEIFQRILSNLPDAISLGVLWGIMALGVYITYKLLDIADLSVDGSFALGGCVSSILIVQGMPAFSTVGIALLAGCLAGLLTGFLHTILKIPAILSGILTMLALYSINLRILGGKSNLALPNQGKLQVTTIIDYVMDWLNLSRLNANLLFGFLLVAALIAILYWFFGTELGSIIRATGNNEAMARAMGGNTNSIKMIGLALSNGLVAMSGAVVAQSQRYGDVGMGTGTIVIGLASIIIGEVIFGKNRHFSVRLISVIGGSVVYRIVIAVVLVLGMNTNDLKILSAAVVAIALSAPVLLEKSRKLKNRSTNTPAPKSQGGQKDNATGN